MAAIMLAFTGGMYQRRAVNVMIVAGSLAAFGIALWLARSQVTVDDVDYMRAIISHHSIAIMTSEPSQISDPRVRELADEIIEAQRQEIAEMKQLIADLDARDRTQ
jgi:uncharacterized protein (DUF305 family)